MNHLVGAFALALSLSACTTHPSPPTMPTDNTLRGHGDTSTIALHITMKVKPEYEQAFVELATAIAGRVYGEEPGVLTYTMYKHPTEASTYVWIERYRDDAAYATHMASPYMADAMQKLPVWLAAPPTMVRYAQLLPR